MYIVGSWSFGIDLNIAQNIVVLRDKNWKLFKNNYLKALNERSSEWTHLFNLAKQFWGYLNFSARKKEFFRQGWEGTYIWHYKEYFDGLFCNFLEIKTHNFAKNHLNFKITGFMQHFVEFDIKKVLISKL